MDIQLALKLSHKSGHMFGTGLETNSIFNLNYSTIDIHVLMNIEGREWSNYYHFYHKKHYAILAKKQKVPDSRYKPCV